VTGGAGFIGRHFVGEILGTEPGATVVVLDKLTYAGNLANLAEFEGDPRYRFVHGDICNPEVVDGIVAGGIDVIVNFAAETHVDRSIGSPGGFVQTDVYGTYVLLEAAKRHPPCRFLQVSTDEVYGEVLGDPVTEEAPLYPRNPYSASKAGADRLAFSYWATYEVPVCITRCSNNYGPYQYPEKLIPLFVTNAIEGESVPVYGTGKNVRDWIHAADHVAALHALIEQDCFGGEVYNIAGGNERSVLEIADVILEALDRPASLVRHVTDRPGHDRRYAIDDVKVRDKTGWKPARSFKEGMIETINWYRGRRDWWEPIKSGEFREYYLRQYAR
jgi:dTDP-glucose 4,6-dehydratase